jgi:hypothetical protein
MNTSLADVPNPLGPAFLPIADARDVLQDSLDAWNVIPTSYVESHIVNTTAKTTNAGFDFVNELTFRTAASFTAIASSPSVSLIEDVTLEDGDQIDNDGDSDVSSAITTAADVDGDGDIEFPAGFYKAGTILDNDVQFNTKTSNGFRFTVADADADTVARSTDLMAIAVHEFGHSIGLSHTLDNQIGAADGTGTTMFPFIDTGDPAAELSQRSLGTDDIAWASYHYPEGSAPTGLPAVQTGDQPFASVYGLIEGEIRHGVLNQPIAGASVAAYQWDVGTFASAGFSGTTQVSYNPVTGGLGVISAAFNILDGKFTIPVPKGSYAVGVEAMDGAPVAAANVSLTGQIGSLLGQLNFEEEFYNAQWESRGELRPGQKKSVVVKAGLTTADIDLTTSRNFNINRFGNRNFIGFTGQAGLSYYAVQVTAAISLRQWPRRRRPSCRCMPCSPTPTSSTRRSCRSSRRRCWRAARSIRTARPRWTSPTRWRAQPASSDRTTISRRSIWRKATPSPSWCNRRLPPTRCPACSSCCACRRVRFRASAPSRH